MKTTRNVLIIVAVICVAAGIVIFAGAFAASGFGLRDLPNGDYEIKTHTISEAFDNIEVKAVESDVIIMPSDGDETKVECLSGERVSYSVEVINKTLTVTRQDNTRWWEHIGFFLTVPDYDVKVYLPAGDYEDLKVVTVSGGISVDEGLSFNNVTLKSVSGKIRSAADILGELDLSTTSGDVTAKSISGDKLLFSTTSGNLRLENAQLSKIELVSVSGDMQLSEVTAEISFKIKTVSGNVDFRYCDGGDINVKTVSGDVEGSLLSEKDFDVNTVSGDVSVPHNSDASQHCRISTTSGDVEITVE